MDENFLEKLINEEMREDKDNNKIDPETTNKFEKLLGFISCVKLAKIGKSAIDMKSQIINKLYEDLGALDKSEKASWHARASAKIELCNKKLNALNSVVSLTSLAMITSDNEESINKMLETFVQRELL